MDGVHIMKVRFSMLRKISSLWKRIHLVDKCLFIFMVALLVQSTFGIFFTVGTGEGSNGIDVIVRTSAAAIFGYFLSGNFAREKKVTQPVEETKPLPPVVKADTAQIEAANDNDAQKSNGEHAANQLQIIIATVVGMFCLITLAVIRNSSDSFGEAAVTQDVTATVSMFRDFVSGCVGFLIGSPTEDK